MLAVQRTPVGRTTMLRDAGWPRNVRCGTKPKRRLSAPSREPAAVAVRESPARAMRTMIRARTGTSWKNREFDGEDRAALVHSRNVAGDEASLVRAICVRYKRYGVTIGEPAQLSSHGAVADSAARPDHPGPGHVPRARTGLAPARPGDSPSQQPSLKRQRGHCHVPWRQSIVALQRRHRSTAGTAFSRISSSVEKAPDGAASKDTTGAHLGRPGYVVLEEPDQQNDDHDEREKSATDVHSGLLYAVDVGTTAPLYGRLRANRVATMRAPRRRGRVVRQRPAKPRTAVRVRSAPSPLDVDDEVER